MPSPNVVKKTSEKKANLGLGLAKRKSQDFGAKIHGWNDGGGEARTAQQDALTEIISPITDKAPMDVEEGDISRNLEDLDIKGEKPSPPKTPNLSNRSSRKIDHDRQAWVRKRSKPQAEITDELKQATTPKKRLVSDGHWRKDQDSRDATPELTPKASSAKRSVASFGLKVPPSSFDVVEVVSETRSRRNDALKQPRSRSPLRPLRNTRETNAAYEDGGLKIYINKPRKRSQTFAEGNAQRDSTTSGSSFAGLSASTGKTTPLKESPPRPSTAPREKGDKSYFALENETRRPSTRKSRGEADRVAHEPRTAPATPHGRGGNRIHGWLSGTPDPFVDHGESSLTPEPLKISKRSRESSRERRPVSRGEEDRGRRKISGAALSKPSEDRIKRKISGNNLRARPNLEPIDIRASNRRSVSPAEVSEASSPSTPTLQRSGARRAQRSPVKSRAGTPDRTPEMRPALSREVSHTTMSSRDSASLWTPRNAPAAGRLSTILSEATSDYTSSRTYSEARSLEYAPSDSGLKSIVPGESALSLAGPIPDEQPRESTGLKRRLTKHEDLMSVLSLPLGDQGSLVSARSVRSRRPRSNSTTLDDVMKTLTTDEAKYQRELRTLVDGVIPVLLTYVLQRTDPSGSKRLFSSTSKDGQLLTRPIVDMGISLERLKATHKRVPLQDPDDLLRWIETATKVYTQYIKTWRLGFEDIVVNLAPADDVDQQISSKTWDNGLPRNKQGDLTSGDGERVDVAYLLKRPLVRLKHLSKALKTINQIRPSAKAQDLSNTYQELVTEARKRANDERARIEDEAAAGIDPTRARDPRSLEPLAGVRVDSTRSVRARDYFDLDFLHSNGQQITCKIEVIIRDDAPDRGSSSDVLFCEVSLAGRWLLFPPIASNYVSARHGDQPGQLVIMVRGMTTPDSAGREWREVMSLSTQDDYAAADWLEMLGTSPIPSRLSKKSSFRSVRALPPSRAPVSRPEPVPEVEVPLGVQAKSGSRIWDGSDVNSIADDSSYTETVVSKPARYRGAVSPTLSAWTEDSYEEVHSRHNSTRKRSNSYSQQHSRSRYHNRPQSSQSLGASEWTSVTEDTATTPKNDYSVWMPPTDQTSDYDSFVTEEDDRSEPGRPGMGRKKSSVPSADLPTIPRVRQSSPTTSPREAPDDYFYEQQEPSSAPAKLQKTRAPDTQELAIREPPQSPSPSGQVSNTAVVLRSNNAAQTFSPKYPQNRRSSSPLKHEYAPSSDSESLTDSDMSDLDDIESVTSESTPDEEAISTVGELRNFKSMGSFRPKSITPSASSLNPSESASQAGYKNVTEVMPMAETIATLFSWADSGSWNSLHPEEVCIIVTPGLIEAFDMALAHGVDGRSAYDEMLSPSKKGVKPLIALELTPLVPLRRGTALDISIRSPPTQNSALRASNNIMFRSRTTEECEKLYALINRARIDNPTFIALQNARAVPAQSNWGEIMDRRNDSRPNSSSGSTWWRVGSRKGSTYRSSGTRASSKSKASTGTSNSVGSALRRLSGGGSIFNIAKSTLMAREKEGTRSSYSDSLSSGAATPVPYDPRLGTPMGITGAKIRLYYRETASKWRDLGPARLTVMMPPRDDPAIVNNPKATGTEKRIIINGKNDGDTLLDTILGESCFERVARTGIAVSVWSENPEIAAMGGVNSAKTKVYMVQMSSERDAAYTFSLVGKLRY